MVRREEGKKGAEVSEKGRDLCARLASDLSLAQATYPSQEVHPARRGRRYVANVPDRHNGAP